MYNSTVYCSSIVLHRLYTQYRICTSTLFTHRNLSKQIHTCIRAMCSLRLVLPQWAQLSKLQYFIIILSKYYTLKYQIMCNIELAFVLIFTFTLFFYFHWLCLNTSLLDFITKCETNTHNIIQYFVLASFPCSFQDRCQSKWNDGSSIVLLVMTERKHLILSVVLNSYEAKCV